MAKKKAVSDSYLNDLWREAIRIIWNHRCARADETCEGRLEAHHYQHRTKGVLKWDYKNGILLCKKHHNWADSVEGREWVRTQLDIIYLIENDILLPDYLIKHRLSKEEFRLMRKEQLKEIIAGVTAGG